MTTAANRKYFVDVFTDWITEVRSLYDSVNLLKPYSFYGSKTDIVNYITQNEAAKILPYPIVCLMDNFEERHVANEPWYTVNPTIYIVNESLVKYDPSERYTNIIKPILYPVMTYLLNVIEFSSNVSQANENLDYIKKIYNGQIDGDVLPDTVDCIELKFSNLRIKNYC